MSKIEVSTMSLRATLILQSVISKGKKIICEEGRNWFEFIESSFLKTSEKPKSTINTELEERTVPAPATSVQQTSKQGRRITRTSTYKPEDDKKKKQQLTEYIQCSLPGLSGAWQILSVHDC